MMDDPSFTPRCGKCGRKIAREQAVLGSSGRLRCPFDGQQLALRPRHNYKSKPKATIKGSKLSAYYRYGRRHLNGRFEELKCASMRTDARVTG